jgi:superfamily II DNA or RNA helicase
MATVVLVHTEELRQQWLERLGEYLPQARRASYTKDLVMDDYDVVVAMLQTMSMKTTERFKKVGMLIVDEAHHICATTLRLALDKFGRAPLRCPLPNRVHPANTKGRKHTISRHGKSHCGN